MSQKPIDSISYATIIALIDAAEEWLVRHGRCNDDEASDYVTLRYLYWATGLIAGATVYLPTDERQAAEFFLTELPGARTKLRSVRRRRSCVELLASAPHRFFPNFDDILRSLFQRYLAATADPIALQLNGITLLAAAALPEYRAMIRRELRRRGGSSNLLVCDDDLFKRVNNSARFAKLIASAPNGMK